MAIGNRQCAMARQNGKREDDKGPCNLNFTRHELNGELKNGELTPL